MSEKTFNNVKITSSFDIPEAKENLVSGETIGKHFGKIAKHMEDESIHHTVDDKLSITSTNPLQNKVATEKFASKEIYGGTTINVGRMVATTVGANSSTIGVENIASGMMSFAEGYKTTASGSISHAEGQGTEAKGQSSHTEGQGTIANNTAEHASGRYNVSNEDTLFSIGDGTSDDERHNAFEITKTGGKLHDKNIATVYDIPTSLPANGGNADTVGGIGIADLRQITQTVINTLPDVPNGEGDYFVNCSQSDTSFPYWYGLLSVRYGSYTGEYVATFRTTGNDNKVYYNTYLTNHWSGWQEISATPIKSTQISGTTGETGNVQLWTTTDKRIPIAALITDRYGYIFPSSNGYYYVGIYHPDNHTFPTSETVNGIIYYIEPAEVKIS